MLKRILVPLDGSALAERALPFAQGLARAGGGRLVLLHGLPPGAETRYPELEQEVGERLQALADQARAEGIEVESEIDHVYHEHLGRGIAEAAAERAVDLIVMSSHGRSGPGRWLYGSVTDETLRHTDHPVLMVPLTCEQAWPTGRPERILVALDGGELSERMLDPALALAGLLGSKLLLTRVVEPRRFPFSGNQLMSSDEYEQELASARGYLENHAAALAGRGPAVELHVDLGPPDATLALAARARGADLIAMTTHGRVGLARFALGSVATGTLHRANVPLLLARPDAVAPRGDD